MYRLTRNNLLMISALLALAGCETVVDVEPPPHTPQLVAQSFFTQHGLWAVHVSSTVPFTSAEAPGLVENATVEIWDGDRLLARPARVDSGTYVDFGNAPAPGRPYTLRVAAPGFDSIEGAGMLPPPVPARFKTTAVPPADSSRRLLTNVALTLDDPPEKANYYGLMVLQVRLQENRKTGNVKTLPPTLFTFESDNLALEENSIAFLDTEKSIYREAFFSDGLFDGTKYQINFDVQYDAPRPDAEIVIHRVLFAVVLSASEDFYRYWTTSGRQAFSNENPFAEPLRVHSNLSGGFGIFAGYQFLAVPLNLNDLDVAGLTPAIICGVSGLPLSICGVQATP